MLAPHFARAVAQVVAIESVSGGRSTSRRPTSYGRVSPCPPRRCRRALHTIVAIGHSVDSSFDFSSVDDAGWLYSFASAADRGFPGGAVFADLGHLGPGQYVELIRSNSLFGVSPEWTALGLEVDG